MDKTLLILVLGLTSFYTASALVVGIHGPDERRLLKPGKGLDLICQFDMGLQVILEYKIHWVHTPSAPNAKATSLTDQQSLLPSASDAHYAVDVSYNDKEKQTNVTLTLKKAVSNMDGNYTCRATAIKGGEVLEKEVMVIVPSDASKVTLDFDGEEASAVSQVTVQREEGKFSVSCRTAGFHPVGPLQLFLGNTPLDAGAPDISLDSDASKSAGARRRKASLQVKKLKLSAADTGKVLRCVAQADFDGAVEKVASMPLEIIALEPEIRCDNNASGGPGDRYLRLTCHVNHERVDVDYYRFEIGDTGEFIKQNEKSDKFDTVLVDRESDAVDHVTLVLYEASEWHFDTYYYLDVFLKNKQKFRMKAKILKRDGTAGASKPVAYVLCLLLSVLVWSL